MQSPLLTLFKQSSGKYLRENRIAVVASWSIFKYGFNRPRQKSRSGNTATLPVEQLSDALPQLGDRACDGLCHSYHLALGGITTWLAASFSQIVSSSKSHLGALLLKSTLKIDLSLSSNFISFTCNSITGTLSRCSGRYPNDRNWACKKHSTLK